MLNSVYEYVISRSKDNNKFRQSILDQYQRNARFSRMHIKALLLPLFMLTKAREKKKYFFFSTKYDEIIKKLPRDEVCIIGGPKQLLFAVKNNLSLISNMDFWGELSEGLKDYKISPGLPGKSRALEAEIRKLILPNSVFIIDNDSMPMQRLLIDIMRKCGAKICLVQDGIFQEKTAPHIIHGWYSDRVLCYDVYQQKIIANKLPSHIRIDVVGFYKKIHFYELSKNACKICFLGQPWYKYGEDYCEKYLSILSSVENVFQNHEFYYKPHPWEDNAPYIHTIKNIVKGSMDEAFGNFDVFISLTSTALLEATLAGKIAIQVIDDKFECDDLATYNYAYSLPSGEISTDKFEQLINRGPILKVAPTVDTISLYTEYFQQEKYM